VQSVDVAMPFAPVVFKQDLQSQVVYELHITNFQRTDITLTSVRVETADAVLGDFSDAELRQRLVRPGLRNDHATPDVVGPGMRAVLNLWLPVRDDFAPGTLTHTIALRLGSTVTEIQKVLSVNRGQPTVIDAPLGGGHWVAIYDPLLKGGHRTAIYTIQGGARIPGRFAIDFIRMPPGGTYARTPEVSDWNGRGADVLAVADGVIVAALDGEPDEASQPVAADKASGNYIAIDIGGGRYAFYEHLQRNSVRVKTGQRVARGDVIAKLGSSGSSSIGPHLHFHIADANSVLGAEGMPFVFRRYTDFGGFSSIDALMGGQPWKPGASAYTAFDARPAPNSVISFR